MTRRRSSGSSADYLPGHGDPSYDVDHYDLDLVYKVETNHLTGRAEVAGTALVDGDAVRLDLRGLQVDKVLFDGRRVKFRTDRHAISIRPDGGLRAGQRFTVSVRYAGRPSQVKDRHLGDAGWEELENGALVAAQPHGSPAWFPCNDRPSNKASYSIAITVPTGYRAVSNGLLVDQRHHASSTTWTYEQTEPMATYLAAVHVGHYVEVPLDGGGVATTAWTPRTLEGSLAEAFGKQSAMIKAFVDMFGPYPFRSYAVVVTEDELEIPLESQGLSTFGSNHLSGDWESVRLVAHELSHQWFGNSLTIGDWRDIWLHEGFACYAEWLWSEASGGESAHDLAVTHHELLADLKQDLLLSDPGPDFMFDDRVYKRGALTLHALRLELGDDLFFSVLRDWVETHAHGTVSTLGFRAFVLERAGSDLSGLLDDWLDELPLPDLPSGG